MTALRLVRFLNDLTHEFGPSIPISQLPLGVLESESKRERNGNGAAPSASEGGLRAAITDPPSPSRYYTTTDTSTPPRPSDLPSDAERDAWEAAHNEEPTTHKCVLGRMHDGPCRCHCGRLFPFRQVGL